MKVLLVVLIWCFVFASQSSELDRSLRKRINIPPPPPSYSNSTDPNNDAVGYETAYLRKQFVLYFERMGSDIGIYDAYVGLKKWYCAAIQSFRVTDPDTCDSDKPVPYLIKSTQRINNSPGYALQGGIYQGVEDSVNKFEVKLILTTPRLTAGSVVEMSASYIDPKVPTKIDSVVCQTIYKNDTQIVDATYELFDIMSPQLPYRIPVGATPAASYNSRKDIVQNATLVEGELPVMGTPDWNLKASKNSCSTYFCTFECDLIRNLVTPDLLDIRFRNTKLFNLQVGYKIYSNQTITASGLQEPSDLVIQ